MAAPERVASDHGKDDRNPANVIDIKVRIRFRTQRSALVDIDVVDDKVQWHILERLRCVKIRIFPLLERWIEMEEGHEEGRRDQHANDGREEITSEEQFDAERVSQYE